MSSQARLCLADIRTRIAASPARRIIRLHRIHELRVKLKSLAAEIRIIKAEITKAARGIQSRRHDVHLDAMAAVASMMEHVAGLRRTFRAAVVALGFLRGRLFREIEPSAKTEGTDLVPLLDEVEKHVIRFGPPRCPRSPFPDLVELDRDIGMTWAAWREEAIGSARRPAPPVTGEGSAA